MVDSLFELILSCYSLGNVRSNCKGGPVIFLTKSKHIKNVPPHPKVSTSKTYPPVYATAQKRQEKRIK